jgi:branched-chain amino acid transport system substrate-binding protein
VVLSVASDCSQQGYTPWEIALDGAVSLSFQKAPGINNHFIGSEPDIPFFVNSTPAAKAMNAAMNKYAKSTVKSPNYNEQATQMYLSGVLFADAATAGKLGVHGAPTTAELYKGLYSLKHDTLGGLAPPLTFTKGKPTPVDCWYWISIKKGKFTTPYGTKPVCVKPPVAP